MNLARLLQRRHEAGKPVRVGMIGCGKFGTMFAAQALRTPGLELTVVCDLRPEAAARNLVNAGWPAGSLPRLVTGAAELIGTPGLDLVIEATGDAVIGAGHALQAIEAGKHVAMVNVEADVLVGPALAEAAERAGVVYSLAYGDQPALICEQVDWARAIGLEVVAAGKGTKYLPHFHHSTPDTVWPFYGRTAEEAAAAGMNPKMFNSFLDGTKSAIEMAAVANATGLGVPTHGLGFPPCGTQHLPLVLRPEMEGGCLERSGIVEVVSSVERDGRPVFGDLRWGVYVVFAAPSDYTRRCFAEYGLITDPSGRYAALWRPYHLIGLELGITVASAVLRGEATGAATGWRGEVAATAKRDLVPGDLLDGEGGYTVYGKLMPAAAARRTGALPIGLAHGARLVRPVPKDGIVTESDVSLEVPDWLAAMRRAMLPAA
ncbi:MAG: Gfo/Idh/MocA family oxidoreductase [Geminicoccaceae bacterium]